MINLIISTAYLYEITSLVQAPLFVQLLHEYAKDINEALHNRGEQKPQSDDFTPIFDQRLTIPRLI